MKLLAACHTRVREATDDELPADMMERNGVGVDVREQDLADRRAHADLITHTLAPVVHCHGARALLVPARGVGTQTQTQMELETETKAKTETETETLLSTSFQCADQKMKKKMSKQRTKQK